MPFNTDNTVAVIVPVYNMEKYIGRCIDSLKRQTHPHCLFLIVDDGSTDQSLFKIKEQTQNDSRFVLLHKTNGGVSSARNYALDYIQQNLKDRIKYLSFVDSDDYISDEFLIKMTDHAEKFKTDCAICAYQTFTKLGNSRKIEGLTLKTLSHSELITQFFNITESRQTTQRDCYTSIFLSNRLYRYSAISAYRFNTKIRACEDQDYIIHCLKNLSSGICVPHIGYFYRKRISSLSNETHVKKHDYICYENLLKEKGDFEPHIQIGIDHRAKTLLWQLIFSTLSSPLKNKKEDIVKYIDAFSLIDNENLTPKDKQRLQLLKENSKLLLVKAYSRKLLQKIRFLSNKFRYYR